MNWINSKTKTRPDDLYKLILQSVAYIPVYDRCIKNDLKIDQFVLLKKNLQIEATVYNFYFAYFTVFLHYFKRPDKSTTSNDMLDFKRFVRLIYGNWTSYLANPCIILQYLKLK